MVKLVSAPFHPDLEDALVNEVRTAKQDDPLRPLAILVPSQHLARRVKWLLAVERRMTLLEVYVITFHQLAMTLIREHKPPALPTLATNAFREEMLRSLVGRGLTGTEPFQHWTGIRGIWSGIWATIQDLKEARIEPQAVLAAIEEGLIGRVGSGGGSSRTGPPPAMKERERVSALVRLYMAVLEADKALDIADPDDLAQRALERIPDSSFLRRMGQVLYYGFYDLTQGQFDSFRAVSGHYPTTVFFPLESGNPNYRFAQQFFDSYITGLTGEEHRAERVGRGLFPVGSLAAEMAPSVFGTLRIYSAVGLDDEVSAAAKEIVRLIEEQRIEPMEIGVVARALDPVLPVIRRVFEENGVPFACATGEGLIQQPLITTLVQFLRLRTAGFPRAAVVDVLASPFCRRPMFENMAAAARPDRGLGRGVQQDGAPSRDEWDWITRRLNITLGNLEDGGLGEWRRLERAAERDCTLPGEGGFGRGVQQDGAPSRDEDNGLQQPALSKVQAGLLWQLVTALHADLTGLPERAGWADYTRAFLELLPKWFELPAWNIGSGETPADMVQLSVRECLQTAANLSLLDEDVSLEQWSEHVIRVLERARLPARMRDVPGVQVLDAMDARGSSFRALFVIGLNEKVFPRSVQEDAFLRDTDREGLARDLGYKIPRKLDGFEEERLLFALLLRSARERLYLSYQRADRSGRAMAPSGYLAELQQQYGTGQMRAEVAIRRRPTERWSSWPYEARFLTPREMALSMILKRDADEEIFPAVKACLAIRQAPDLFEYSLRAATAIETAHTLTSYDGLVGADLLQPMFSPTALQRYARCPFQYFAAQVLGIEPLPAPESVTELGARTRGELCHAILRRFYERMHRSGVTADGMLPLVALQWLSEEANKVYHEFEESKSVGYPLLWELAKDQITALLEQVVLFDLAEMTDSGYTPAFFEIALQGTLDSSSATPLQICGKLDRVDFRELAGSQHLRVVDYKYLQGDIKQNDRNLLLAAVRGQRLQLPLYLHLVRYLPFDKPVIPDSAACYFFGSKLTEPPIQVNLLESNCWEGDTGRLLHQTLGLIILGIQQGRFAILPGGDYCGYCDFRATCRVTHEPTRRRARTDAGMKALKELRDVKLNATNGTDTRTNENA